MVEREAAASLLKATIFLLSTPYKPQTKLTTSAQQVLLELDCQTSSSNPEVRSNPLPEKNWKISNTLVINKIMRMSYSGKFSLDIGLYNSVAEALRKSKPQGFDFQDSRTPEFLASIYYQT